MEEIKKLIIVPWDFTNVAESALAHAVKIGRMVGNDICLLHIVDPDVKVKAEGEKRALLKHVAEENSKKYNMNIISDCQRAVFSLHSRFCKPRIKRQASL